MKFNAKLLSLSVLLVFFLMSANNVMAVVDQNGDQPKPFIIKGLVTIQFEDDVEPQNLQKGFGKVRFGMPSLDVILDDYEVSDARKLFPWRTEKPSVNSGLHDLTRFYEISFPENVDVNKVVKALLQNPNVRHAEPVWALPLLINPNDPEYYNQWYMSPYGNDPHFYDAWEYETGSDSIKLAMIDSGVNYKHRDLAGNIWVNPGEDIDGDGVVYDIDDLNNVDDDGNGIVDDLIGYDFFTGLGGGVWPGEDGGTVDSDPNDFSGHGTNCAGIAAAMNNNNTDVTGAAGGWYGGSRSFRGARIMCLRVGATGSDGKGYVNSNNCGTAIDYAASNGANVISASWGSSNTSTMAAGMANAAAHGVTVTHAAGNDDCDCPDYLDFNPSTNVLSVASTTSSDIKSSFSNFGTWVDVSAPGSSILNTYSDQYTPTLATLSGTSMAAPMVAGVALLIRSAMPSLSKVQVDSILTATADNIDLLNPFYAGRLGTGRINAYNALLSLAHAKFTADVTSGEAPMTVTFTDQTLASPDLPSSWNWSFGNGDGSTDQNPVYTYNDPGIYSVSLIADVNNPLGYGEEHLKNYIWVRADTLRGDSIKTKIGNKVVVPVYLTNTSQIKDMLFSFTYASAIQITLDSFSVAGLRTAYMYSVAQVASAPVSKKYAIQFTPDNPTSGGSNYLQPGTEPIVNLYFTIGSSGAPGGTILIDTTTFNGKTTKLTSVWGDFTANFTPGKIYVELCPHGDANCDGAIGISDLTALVNYMFSGGSVDPYGGDVNGDGGILINDITYLVDYMFNGGPPPPN